MKADIIIVGEEILSGQTIDSNSAYIARKLSDIGIPVELKITVGDRHEDIRDAVKASWKRSSLIIMTGGLGPTKDDTTKAAIAEAFGKKMIHRPEVLRKLEALYEKRRMTMPEIVKNQTMQPEGCELLDNPIGSAPGILIRDAGRMFIALPGVPSEMEALVDQAVIPLLVQLPGRDHIAIRRIRTIGITEAAIAEKIADLEPSAPHIRLAYLPSYKGVDLRVTVISPDESVATSEADSLAQAISSRIRENIFTIGDQTLVEMVGEELKKKHKTLSTAESCTGGLIAKMITDEAGSSEYFVGTIVSYSNDVKEHILGVPTEVLATKGAVSQEVAEAMAQGALRVTGSDYAISVTGIAGPGGATPEKPVGLVYVGLAEKGGATKVDRLQLFGTRERIRERSAMHALEMLRKQLQ